MEKDLMKCSYLILLKAAVTNKNVEKNLEDGENEFKLSQTYFELFLLTNHFNTTKKCFSVEHPKIINYSNIILERMKVKNLEKEV